MTEEKYLEIKEGYVNNIKRYLLQMGNIFPHITVFGTELENPEKSAIIHIPIEGKFLKSEETKDLFVDEIVPEIAKKLKERFVTEGVAWTSEAWIREFPTDKGLPDNWKSAPIKEEVLMINLQFPNKTELMVYEIKRLGKQVNDDGDLTDHIELIERDISNAEHGKGRLTNLLEKFTAHS